MNAEKIQENWDKLIGIINDTFEGERKENLLKFYGDFQERMMFAPASAKEHYHNALKPTVDYWLNNLDKLNSNEKTKHIQTLELSSKYLKQFADNVLREYGLSTFIFEKK